MVIDLTKPPYMVAMNPTPCIWVPRCNDFDVDIVKIKRVNNKNIDDYSCN